MSNARDAIVVTSKGIVVCTKRPANGEELFMLISSEVAHDLGLGLIQAAWDFEHGVQDAEVEDDDSGFLDEDDFFDEEDTGEILS